MSAHRVWMVALLAIGVGSCSHLAVKTEVYVKDFREVQEGAAVIRESLEDMLAQDSYGPVELFKVIDEDAIAVEVASISEELFQIATTVSSKSDLTQVLAETLRTLEKVELERSRIRSLIRDARRLEVSDPPLYPDPNELLSRYRRLQDEYREVLKELRRPFEDIAEASKEEFGDSIRLFYSKLKEAPAGAARPPVSREEIPAVEEDPRVIDEPEVVDEPPVAEPVPAEPVEQENDVFITQDSDDPLIKKLFGKTADERREIIEHAAIKAEKLGEQLGKVAFPEEAKLLDQAKATMTQVEMLSLSDPAVPRVVTAPDSHWKGLYNNVLGRTSFGNAEIAIRMESLGEFHMKGVVFDPSKVTQATLDGIDTAVQIAAAATGVPLPSGGDSESNDGADAPAPLYSKAALRAQVRELSEARAQSLARQADGFFKLLGHLRTLPPQDPAAVIAAEIRALAADLRPDQGEPEVAAPPAQPPETPPAPADPVEEE